MKDENVVSCKKVPYQLRVMKKKIKTHSSQMFPALRSCQTSELLVQSNWQALMIATRIGSEREFEKSSLRCPADVGFVESSLCADGFVEPVAQMGLDWAESSKL